MVAIAIRVFHTTFMIVAPVIVVAIAIVVAVAIVASLVVFAIVAFCQQKRQRC